MSKNKLILSASIIILICISLGFFISPGGDLTTAVSFSSFTSGTIEQSDYLGTWSVGTPIPSPGSYGGAGVSYTNATGDTCWLYCINGNVDGSGLAPGQFRRYNMRTNTWEELGFYPTGRHWLSAGKIGPISNTNMYVVGGLPSNATSWIEMTGTLQRYSINAGTWTIMAPSLFATGSSGVSGYQDSLLYVVGGMGTTGQPIVYVQLYNQTSGTWRAATPLPVARANGWMVIKSDTIYYGCGAGPTTGTFNNNIYIGVISQSDRATITWTTSAVTYPGTNRHRMDADLFGCNGIFIGPGATATWWGYGAEAYTWAGGNSFFVSVGPAPSETSDAQVGAGSFMRNGYRVWKAVVTSGLQMAPPRHRLTTLVYTDSCLIPMVNVWCEGFTSPTFPPAGWTISGAANLWSRDQVSAFGLGVGSAKADFYNVSTGSQQLNSLTFKPVLNPLLVFADKYCTYVNENDQLEIKASTNGGSTWIHVVTLNGGINGELVTCGLPPPIDWKWQYVTLPQNTNRVQFNAITAYGNNLYIDSICVKEVTGKITPITLTPSEFSLSQNYPNPFNPKTVISFQLAVNSYSMLTIYDILGREIETIVSEVLKPGTYEVEWDGSNYSSGIYFYRLVVKDASTSLSTSFSASRKMLMVK